MNTLGAIFSVLFGLVFGSFLNVCISRLPRGESVVAPRSRCPVCRAPIGASENIPLVSYLLLRGRCRACRAPIPFRYFLVEAVTAALFLLCFVTFGLTLRATGAMVLCFLLIGLAAMDAETMLLPDAFTLPGIALGILYSGLNASGNVPMLAPGLGSGLGLGLGSGLASGNVAGNVAGSASGGFGGLLSGHPLVSAVVLSAATAFVAAGVILLIRAIYWMIRHEEGMGLGDAKLLAMIGAWMGPSETLLVFFLAVVTGAAYGLARILTGRITRSTSGGAWAAERSAPTKVPLGAFLCAACIYSLFAGNRTLQWYFSLFS